MGFKELQETILDIEDMISLAKRIGKKNIVLQDLDDAIRKELINRGYHVMSCERPRIGGHTKFIRLTMIEWKLEEDND